MTAKNSRKFKFWMMLRNYCSSKMVEAYMEGGNCDSCCPRCKQWESSGNRITTEPYSEPDDGSENRVCANCGYSWRAVFTPFGFIPVDKDQPND